MFVKQLSKANCHRHWLRLNQLARGGDDIPDNEPAQLPTTSVGSPSWQILRSRVRHPRPGSLRWIEHHRSRMELLCLWRHLENRSPRLVKVVVAKCALGCEIARSVLFSCNLRIISINRGMSRETG